MRGRVRAVLAGAASLAVLAPLGWLWVDSLVPGTYSMAELGYHDFGGGPQPVLAAGAAGESEGHGTDHGHGGGSTTSVSTLTGPLGRPADVSTTLVARAAEVGLAGAGARPVDGYTLNGSSPGPTIRVREGDLLEVRLVNASVSGGATLHWHGVDVPNAEDGVAGVTQDAVGVGEQHVYRFVADDPGTYWYHSHQVSHEQVRQGLFGTLVVEPADPGDRYRDVVAAVHTYDGQRTINGRVGQSTARVPAGSPVRVRVVNTNNEPVRTWVSGAGFRLVAVDAREWHHPERVRDRAVLVPAGGRADLEMVVPASGARVSVGGDTSLVLTGSDEVPAPRSPEPEEDLDLLTYGRPAPIGFDPVDDADRTFEYRIGRRPGFLDGRPGMWWTINGGMFPDLPMYMVAEGDIVRMTISNDSGEAHPMHLHGHHAVVLSRDGVPASGAPWWTDSLRVEDGETFDIAFVADNPGLWMDHCHNLPHAAEGLMTHLSYIGVTTPYVVGGPHHNEPE